MGDLQIQSTASRSNISAFDPEATNAMNYVLQKNQDLVLHNRST